jgi:hypothetical protein
MQEKCFIIEESFYFKPGQIVEATKVDGGIKIREHFLEENAYIELNEALAPRDEERVREICREILRRMFWRIYTRNAFILK